MAEPEYLNETDEQFFDRKSRQHSETLGRYLNQNVTPYRPVTPLPAYEDTPPPAPPYEYTYPPGSVSFDDEASPSMPFSSAASGADQDELPDIAPAEASGTDSVAPSTNSIIPHRRSTYDRIALALEGFGAGFRGQKPLAAQLDIVDAQQQAHRQAVQLQQQKLEQLKKYQQQQLVRQREAQRDRTIMGLINSGNLDALQAYSDQTGDPVAKNLALALKEGDLQRVQDYQKRGWLTNDDLESVKKMSPSQIRAKLGALDKRAKLVDEAEVKKQDLSNALKKRKAGQEVDAYEEDLLKVHDEESDLRQAKADALRARADQQDKPRVTQMAEELSMELFDKPWDKLNQTQRGVVEGEKEKRLQARTSTMIQQKLPPSLKEQADVYTVAGLDRLELEAAPKGLSESEYRSGPYRQLDDKEKDALVQYKVAEKTVSTMNRVADKLITAQKPMAALKQKLVLEAGALSGSNGLAAAYKKDRDSFSSRMARLVEVGVLTNTDVTRWAQTFGDFGDTVGALKAKQALFGEIQDETRRLLRMRLTGKTIDDKARSHLDELLSKADTYTSTEEDLKRLNIP